METPFDSVLPSYVQRSLDLGAKIVKKTKGCIGMILCPSCHREKGLRPRFEGTKIVSHLCACGHSFTSDEEMILTFQDMK